MKYMLMICDDESVILSPAEVHALPQIQAWDAEIDGRGIRRGGARLRPSSDAATVRVRDGEILVSDGPFAETKEQVGGFDIIECATLDEAVEIAGRHPAAASGAIEVRPLWQELRPQASAEIYDDTTPATPVGRWRGARRNPRRENKVASDYDLTDAGGDCWR